MAHFEVFPGTCALRKVTITDPTFSPELLVQACGHLRFGVYLLTGEPIPCTQRTERVDDETSSTHLKRLDLRPSSPESTSTIE